MARPRQRCRGRTRRYRRRAPAAAVRGQDRDRRPAACACARRHRRAGRRSASRPRLPWCREGRSSPELASAALHRGLERAAGRELRHTCSGNMHLLTRIARVDAGAGLPLLRLELPEAGERDVAAASQGVGDRLEERVDRFPGVAGRELASPGHLRDKLLLVHCRLLSLDHPTLTGYFACARSSPARKSGRSRTAWRASASAPPSSRSTTQTAVFTTSPASRSAVTDSSSAPPEVTTSSTRQTHSPAS